MNDITILVDDDLLCGLIKAELERCGRSVGVCKENCILLITDAESQDENPDILRCYTFCVSREPEKIAGKGFDKVLRRPVSMVELRNSVSEVFDKKSNEKANKVNSSELRFMPDGNIVFGGQTHHLTKTESRLLSFLYQHRGESVSRQTLNSLIGFEKDSADVYICYLRKKLTYDGRCPIITVRGTGYMLK